MSIMYYISAVIPGLPTEEMVRTIITNIDQLNPLAIYHEVYDKSESLIESLQVTTDEAISIACQELLIKKRTQFFYSFDCLDEECSMYAVLKSIGVEHRTPAYVSFWKGANATIVDFSPEGVVPCRNSEEDLQIHYDWYISRLLKITEPYPLVELVAGNDYFWDAHDLNSRDKEWQVVIDSTALNWAFFDVNTLTDSDFKDIEDHLLRLKEKYTNKGYELIDFDIPKLLKAELPFVLTVKAEWGKAQLVIGKNLSILPFPDNEKPLNLRPYITLAFDLLAGTNIYYLEAFNGINYHDYGSI